MSEIREIDSAWLKEQLQHPGRSQVELAKRLGVDGSAVNRLVNGKRQLKAREIPIVRAYLAETARGAPTPTEKIGQIRKYDLANAISDPDVVAGYHEDIYAALDAGDDRLFIERVDRRISISLIAYLRRKLTPETVENVLGAIGGKFITTGVLIELCAAIRELPLEVLNDLRRIGRVKELFDRQRDVATLDAPEVAEIYYGTWPLSDTRYATPGDGIRAAVMLQLNLHSNYLLLEFDQAKANVDALYRWAERNRPSP